MKKVIKTVALLFIMIVTITGCVTSKSEIEYKKIDMNETITMIETNKDLILLDVRTRNEYGEGHIPSAVNIPNETIGNDMSDILKDKNQTILIYCRSGNRSKQAAEKLINQGYTNVYDIGGINNWPKELEK